MASSTAPSTTTTTTPDRLDSSTSSARSRKQLTLFFAGASFLALSTIVARRSIIKRRLAIMPTFYHPSNLPPKQPVNGAMEAFEALNIATVNVAGFAMMATGGFLWAFDISSLDDLRRKVRGGLGADGTGRSERDVEEEFEEWMATVLERKKDKEERKKQKSTESGGADNAKP